MLEKTANGFIDREFYTDTQAVIHSEEWQAAFVVYDKLHKKLKLSYKDLELMYDYLYLYTRFRKLVNKKAHRDLMIQEISLFVNCLGKIDPEITFKRWNK